MKRILLALLIVGFLGAVLAGCSSCPDKVTESLRGDLRDWRLVKKDLVQTMPEGPPRDLWMQRTAAFIVRARANVAWAEGVDFDTARAFEEEIARVE